MPLPPAEPFALTQIVQIGHPEGLKASFMPIGASWLSCLLPSAQGKREVLLGCATLEDYRQQQVYMGATIGRYANRIAHGRFQADGGAVHLSLGPGESHQLHGGPGGFHSRTWTLLDHTDTLVRFGLVSEDGDQGFPGRCEVQVSYSTPTPWQLLMETTAQVSAACPVGLTQHAYFNLDGHTTDVRHHQLQLRARQVLPVDRQLIPLGALESVKGSIFDFSQLRPIALDIHARQGTPECGAYDHAYLLDPMAHWEDAPALELISSDQSLSMHMHTSLPALQLYTGEHLNGTPSRSGAPYGAHQGIALEPQFLPDSPNHPEWPQPSCWLRPGQTYRHFIQYSFVWA